VKPVSANRTSLGKSGTRIASGNVSWSRPPSRTAKPRRTYQSSCRAAICSVAHCHLGLGKLYRRTDKREQAREHLATATTMYREMGMTYWLEKAEAELG
jgi:hypothetical protein